MANQRLEARQAVGGEARQRSEQQVEDVEQEARQPEQEDRSGQAVDQPGQRDCWIQPPITGDAMAGHVQAKARFVSAGGSQSCQSAKGSSCRSGASWRA
jgi:hypothetical protein